MQENVKNEKVDISCFSMMFMFFTSSETSVNYNPNFCYKLVNEIILDELKSSELQKL